MSSTTAPIAVATWLDCFLVGATVVLLGGGIAILAFVHIPQENLPILASLLSFLGGTVLGGYTGYRWGASDQSKRQAQAQSAPTDTKTSDAA